jgi:uncharacterized protein YecE (DUF72 family)
MMPQAIPSIRIGTCGWSYKDWVGHFYPENFRAADYLPFYADRFPVVEVDSSFYRCATHRMVQSWRDKTPEKFAFALKVPQSITHEKVLLDCGQEVEEYRPEAPTPPGNSP